MESSFVFAAWHWFVLAAILLGLEAMGAGGFLIGAAVAAMICWALNLITQGLDWQLQIGLFAIMTLVFSVLYWKYFKGFNEQTDKPDINDRGRQLIGRTATVDTAFTGHTGKINIGDTLWRAKTDDDDVQPGDTVEVIDADQTLLIVKKLTATSAD